MFEFIKILIAKEDNIHKYDEAVTQQHKNQELPFVKDIENEPREKATIPLADEEEVKELSKIPKEEFLEIPRASELGLAYKDPRTQEFEGTEKFKESLTHIMEFEKNIVVDKDVNELSSLIARTNKELTLKYRREHKYNLPKTQEVLYKEITFETSDVGMRNSLIKNANFLKKQKATPILNWDKFYAKSMEK
jgi:hypothetical protein